MLYGLLANFVVLLHLAFVVFVLTGGFLALKWPRTIWFHFPAAVWGALVKLSGWLCPLTPLEQWLRTQGGESGYETDFVAHYLLPILSQPASPVAFNCS